MEIFENPELYDSETRSKFMHIQKPELAQLISTGSHHQMNYEVWNEHSGTTLDTILREPGLELTDLRGLVASLVASLAALNTMGIRHRDIRPANIRIRESAGAISSVLTGFSCAVASDFDLELVPLANPSRYSAPEARFGAVTAASDWWSLGLVLLEALTNGKCFEGIDETVFLLNAIASGVSIPDQLDDETYTLLAGLLERNPEHRWQYQQVERWLKGDYQIAERAAEPTDAEKRDCASITLCGRVYRNAAQFALRCAGTEGWNEALTMFRSGAIGTWFEQTQSDPVSAAFLRDLRCDETLSSEVKLGIALLALNKNIPLSIAGSIVTPSWLLDNIDAGSELISPQASLRLKHLDRERWLHQLADRAAIVRQRLTQTTLKISDERLRPALLCASRRNLENQWQWIRSMFPDSEHPSLRLLMEKRSLSEEDLVILIGTDLAELIPAEELIEQARKLSASIKEVTISEQDCRAYLGRARRDLLDEIDERIAGFAFTGIQQVDEWADAYRLERRLPLARALVILSVPKEHWRPLPKQEYIGRIIDFLEKKVSASIQRGPLVRLSGTKSGTIIDLMDLEGPRRSAAQLLDALVSRTGQSVQVDPSRLDGDEEVENRVRRLQERTNAFRRETGRHGLYLGFPVVTCGMRRSGDQRVSVRVAPVLLFQQTGTGTDRFFLLV